MADEKRRTDDLWMRENMTARMASMETTQRLYHDEIKSITEVLHKQIEGVAFDVKTLNRVVYGGEEPGILENIRNLLWKAGILTTIAVGIMMFLLKLFAPALTKAALKLAQEDDMTIARKKARN